MERPKPFHRASSHRLLIHLTQGLVEGGDERLREPEGEDQLGARHEQLRTPLARYSASAMLHQDKDWEVDVGWALTLGTRPLKKLERPSFLAILVRILKPLSGLSKFLFWMRVLMTSSGADTTSEADAPAIEATKFWNQLALL